MRRRGDTEKKIICSGSPVHFVSVSQERGAKGLDGGYEDQVACRGSVTT